jgi:hypothetical protein
MVLYADDTSIIITDSNKLNFKTNLNRTLNKVNTWFNANLLTLNFQKPNIWNFDPGIAVKVQWWSNMIKKV